MATATVEIHNEVQDGPAGTWRLCFHNATWHYDDRDDEHGFRFIWRRDDDSLQAARGQALIPDAAALDRLLTAARNDGWYP